MKKDELKKVLKPLIKECIKEVIFEEGTLSTIIREVVDGTGQMSLKENKSETTYVETKKHSDVNKLYERKKKLLGKIGADAFNGINIFEGTTPMPREAGSRGPLGDQDPSDPGVDISSFLRPASEMKKLAGN